MYLPPRLQEHQQQLDAGGAAERAAVASLGELVTAGIRRSSVLPTSALLVGALFEAQHSGGGSGGGAPAAAAAGMEWLAGELAQRGAAVMRLPRDAAGAGGTQQQLLLHLASMLPQCCSVGLLAAAAPQANGRRQPAEPVLRLQPGVHATLLQHSRLNQLLPWFAAEGLVVTAALAAERAATGATPAAVLDAGAWLRCILAPEIDTGELWQDGLGGQAGGGRKTCSCTAGPCSL